MLPPCLIPVPEASRPLAAMGDASPCGTRPKKMARRPRDHSGVASSSRGMASSLPTLPLVVGPVVASEPALPALEAEITDLLAKLQLQAPIRLLGAVLEALQLALRQGEFLRLNCWMIWDTANECSTDICGRLDAAALGLDSDLALACSALVGRLWSAAQGACDSRARKLEREGLPARPVASVAPTLDAPSLQPGSVLSAREARATRNADVPRTVAPLADSGDTVVARREDKLVDFAVLRLRELFMEVGEAGAQWAEYQGLSPQEQAQFWEFRA